MDLENLSKPELIQKLQYLEFELTQLKRAIFGSKSERFVSSDIAGQGNLFTESVDREDYKPAEGRKIIEVPKKPKKQPVRQKIPAHLPRVEIVLEPQVNVSIMRRLGEQVSEKLEIKPARIYVHKTVRPKYIDSE